MPRRNRHDTGLCRICCRRYNLNALDNIVRHSHMSYRCDGSGMRPAPNTVERAEHPIADRLSEKERHITLLQRQIDSGTLDAEGLNRARKTMHSLRAEKPFDRIT